MVQNLPDVGAPGKGRAGRLARLALWLAGGGAWATLLLATPPPVPPARLEVGGAEGLGGLWPEGCPPVVASRRGKAYYFAWCEAAESLSAANLRHFCGPEEAERAGYQPAKGCVAPGSGGG